MHNTKSVYTTLPRGDGVQVFHAFQEGKKMGLFDDGDAVVCVHTMRNVDNLKQWAIRILNVTSTRPQLDTKPPSK